MGLQTPSRLAIVDWSFRMRSYVIRPFQQRASARRGEAFDYDFLIDRR
jgi:hypothetical protein